MTRRFIIFLCCIIIVATGIDLFVQHQLAQRYKNDQVLDVSLQTTALRARLEKEITGNLLRIQGAAHFISLTPDLTAQDFHNYAQEVFRGNSLLLNLAAAPDWIITFVHPLEGNEAILGVDYRDLPKQWEQAKQAQETDAMVVAGPLQLLQGGMGLIGRAPVFVRNGEEKRFWGLVSAAIDADQLLAKVGMDHSGLRVAMRGVDGKGANGEVFYGDANLFDEHSAAVLMPVAFPSGSWQLAAMPAGGWNNAPPSAPFIHFLTALLAIGAAIGVYLNIRKNEQLLQVQESLTEAQALARLGSWDMDMVRNELWWSDATYQIFGLEPSTTRPSLDLFFSHVHPGDKAMVEESIHASIQTRQPYSMDHRIICKDSVVRWVHGQGVSEYDTTGNPVRFRGAVLDITERKLAEDRLRAERGQLQAMANASYDAMITIDAQDTILFWSPAAETLFGWSRQEALGQKMHSLIIPEEYREDAARGLKRFARTGKGSVLNSVMEFTALRRNGDRFPVERSVAAFEADGSFYAVGNLRDITERKQAEQELQSFTDRFSLASEAGGVGVWEWNVIDNTLYWDELMHHFYDVRPNEFSGLYEAWRQRVHPDDVEAAEQELMRAMQTGGQWEWEFRVLLPSGETRHIQAAAKARRNEAGEVERMVGVNLDVTESKETQKKLEILATTDGLTGLLNRRRFMELAGREVERSHRYPQPLSMVMFDADRFKLVNDTYGHDVGDLVLKAIASAAGSVLRDVDVLGRLGGEEFAVLLPATGLDGAALAAERLRAAMEAQRVTAGEAVVRFTVSVGVALLQEGETVDALLKRADLALYHAKENGRNRVELG